jgi:DNA integrity scanning protein DisA with diadenylate cyclase activity
MIKHISFTKLAGLSCVAPMDDITVIGEGYRLMGNIERLHISWGEASKYSFYYYV